MAGRRARAVALAALLVLAAAHASVAFAQPRTDRARRVSGVTVAIVDSGVAHIPTLADALRPGRDLVDGDTVADDGNGHGTAMASIVASVCSVCSLLPVRVVGNGGLGSTTTAAAGIRWAVDAGARVINVSLTSSADDPALDAAIADAAARGVVVVVAAGNEGSTEPSAAGYPAAAAPSAISVAGVDSHGRLYSWSNHGSWVTLAAPGSLPARTLRGGSFTAVGTSASAAYVSGVVGEMLSADPGLDPAGVRSILLASAKPTADGPAAVDADAAVAAS